MNVHRSFVNFLFHSPQLIKELAAGKDLVGVRKKLEKQHKFLCGYGLRLTSPDRYALCIVIQHAVTYDKRVFRSHFRPSQQRSHTQHHLVEINRLDHVIVRAGSKPLLLILKSLLCGDHKYRQVVFCTAQLSCKLIAVHIWHHNVRDDKINISLFHNVQRFKPVVCRMA